ncbi:hypothetical protein EVAR_72570_1 [Eumeta japonica]|uniref:Uncharacterized protein n=1 Tax=Eumeta variegata TaxID=151549 RepID=A0A4C1SWR4_EUMVA|nr:hypothetical protein EVAR_72570_1 [Eumeta japonica]
MTDGRLSDEFRDCRPPTAVINKNVNAVRRMIETDRNMTYNESRASLGLDVSQIQSILHKYLGMKKLCSRKIPHNLSEAQKQTASFGGMPCSLSNEDGVAPNLMPLP